MAKPISDSAALAALRERAPFETTYSALARDWAWNRMTVTRRLRTWENEGLLTCSTSADGKRILISVVSSTREQGVQVAPRAAQQGAQETSKALHKPRESAVCRDVQGRAAGCSESSAEPAQMSSAQDQDEQHSVQPVSNVVHLFRPAAHGNLAEQIEERAKALQEALKAPETPPPPSPPAPAATQPAHGARTSEGQDWGLLALGIVALTLALGQATMHAAERANGDPWGLALLALPAFTVGIGGPVLFYKAARRGSLVLFVAGIACLLFNLGGSIGFAASRVDQSAAEGQASHETRARAEASLVRLRERQEMLDRDAAAARAGPECKKRPIQCRARSEAIAKQAAALSPQIAEAERALQGFQVRAAADPASEALGRLMSLPAHIVREGFTVALATLLEALASLGLGFGARRG